MVARGESRESCCLSRLSSHFRIPGQMGNTAYTEARRVNESLLAAVEKRCLIWMANRLPPAINSDHLTVLAGVAMFGAGACYWIGSPVALLISIVLLAAQRVGARPDRI